MVLPISPICHQRYDCTGAYAAWPHVYRYDGWTTVHPDLTALIPLSPHRQPGLFLSTPIEAFSSW